MTAAIYLPAQKKLGFGTDGVVFSSNPICYGDTINYAVHLKNKGNIPFTLDSVRLVGNFITSGVGTIPIETKIISAVTLQPGDSVLVSFANVVLSPRYIANTGNIIVIWPIAPNIATADTVTKNLRVDNCVQTGFNDEKDGNSQVYFDEPNSAILLFQAEEVIGAEVIDLNGRVLYTYNLISKNLALPCLPKGLYLVHLHLENNKTRVFRFVKRE